VFDHFNRQSHLQTGKLTGDRTIGDVLEGFYEEFVPSYQAYIATYAHAPQHIERLRRESKAFASVLKAMERPEENLTLANLLAAPLRRVRAYGQFSQRLFDATPTSQEEEYAKLEKICDKFAGLDNLLSSQSEHVAAMAIADNAGQRLVSLPRVLSGKGSTLPGENSNMEDNGLAPDPKRRLLFEGTVNLLVTEGDDATADRAKMRKVPLFVFSDVVIVGQKAGRKADKLRQVARREEKDLVKYGHHLYCCDCIVFDPDEPESDDIVSASTRAPNSFAVVKDQPANEKSTTGTLPGLGNIPGLGPVPKASPTKNAPMSAAAKSQFEMDGDEPDELVFCFDTRGARAELMDIFREASMEARKSRTFKVPLDELMHSEYSHNASRAVPRFVTKVCQAIRAGNNLDTQGLFRLSGSANAIRALHRKIQQDDWRGSNLRGGDVHTCSGLFKLFFREMPDPVFTYDMYDDWIAAVAGAEGDRVAISKAAKVLVKDLPQFNQFLMAEMFSLLKDTAAHSDKNMMKESNIAIVMSTNVLYKRGQSAFDTTDYKIIYTLLEVMMEYFDDVFADVLADREEFEKARAAEAAERLAKAESEEAQAREARKADKAKAELAAAEVIRAAEEKEAADLAREKQERRAQKKAREDAIAAEAEAQAAAQQAEAEKIAEEKARRKREAKEAAAAAKKSEMEQAAAAKKQAEAERAARRADADKEYEELLAKEKEAYEAKARAKAEADKAAAAAAPAPTSSHPACAGCKKAIESGGLAALDKKWHRECFVCQKCRGALSGSFIRGKEDGMPYCKNCFAQKSGAGSCMGCGQPISGQFFRAMGGTWHPKDCFVCSNCKGSLTAGFFDKGGKPVCKDCATP
jgi:RhoGAP domain/LIM domain/RhoGEF domain